jgi:hypothetical protein
VHRRLFAQYTRSDPVLTALTLFLLAQIALIPASLNILTVLDAAMGELWRYATLGLFGLVGVTYAATWLYACCVARIVSPRPGAWTVAVRALSLAVVPVGMGALGTFSHRPGYQWMPALLPVVYALSQAMQRLARTHDARHAPVIIGARVLTSEHPPN